LSGTGNGDQGNFITVTATPHLRNITGEAKTASATVAGANANAPTITPANPASVAENTTAIKFGTTLDNLTATDPNGNPITFSIVGGLDFDKFKIDPVATTQPPVPSK